MPDATPGRTVLARPALRTRGPVLVVGTGLLGTSIGLGLSARGVPVQLSDPSPTAAALARDLGAGTVRVQGGVQPDVSRDVPDPALVVVAAPPDVTAAVVAAQLRAWPHAVVTDVASVKRTVLAELTALTARTGSPDDLDRYVGGHPLAGRERSGAVAGRGDLFIARPWVLCPSPSSTPQDVQVVTDLAQDLGASVVTMSPTDHDEAVALTSHLPQVAASLVAARLRPAEEAALALAGPGLRDVTRIAASDPALWVQILAANAAPVAAQLRALRGDLDDVLAALDALAGSVGPTSPGALAALATAIEHGGQGRARVPGKHGAAPTAYATVVVLVPDQPGQLARLLADVAAAGVNLEELSLEHAPGQLVGLAAVSVLPGARAVLEEALAARGWTLEG